jgi:hypothetical protein
MSVALWRGGFLVSSLNGCRIQMVWPNGTMTTAAGSSCGSSGNGGLATLAAISPGEGLVRADTNTGGFVFADMSSFGVRRVSLGGIITQVAGSGSSGSTGDGGQATSAQLTRPQGVITDGLGSYFIADQCRVRQVSPAGVISTIAGTGSCGRSGDGGAATAVGALLAESASIAFDASGGLLVNVGARYHCMCVRTSIQCCILPARLRFPSSDHSKLMGNNPLRVFQWYTFNCSRNRFWGVLGRRGTCFICKYSETCRRGRRCGWQWVVCGGLRQ